MISIVIPSHNRPDSLLLALQSVYKQSCVPDEVIVVDDGSKPAVSDDVFSKCPVNIKCRLLRNELPQGANKSRNRGVLEATNEFIAFLDDDDRFTQDKIEKVMCFIERFPLGDIFYHPARIHMPREKVNYVSKRRPFECGEDVFRSLMIENRIGGTSMVIARRHALVQVGLFDEKLPALQDYELWLRLAMFKKKFVLIDEPLTGYFHASDVNSISKSVEKKASARSAIFRKYASAYSTLTKNEVNKLLEKQQKSLVSTHILSQNWVGSVKEQYKLCVGWPSAGNIISLFIVAAGPKFACIARAWLGSS